MNKALLTRRLRHHIPGVLCLYQPTDHQLQEYMNTSAILGFCNTLREIIDKEHPTHLGVAFDHGKTFRHEAYPPYKAQREETPEDIAQRTLYKGDPPGHAHPRLAGRRL